MTIRVVLARRVKTHATSSNTSERKIHTAMTSYGRTLSVVACGLVVVLTAAMGCGQGGAPVTDRQGRRVASAFVKALLAAPTKEEAVHLGQRYGGRAVAETAASDFSDLLAGGEGLQAYGGPRRGCDEAPKDKHCYTFHVVGRVVPQRLNKGYASVDFGVLFVYVQGEAIQTSGNTHLLAELTSASCTPTAHPLIARKSA